ncbi:MAG: ABC transporter permease [Verrucomicrobia bacterium]|nr:ABC transporter permease [Verrucomicrobiota bacterium]
MSSRLPAPLFLAARYLKPKRTFLAVITLISVLGVTLGITVLILVMSVMTGFERELQRKVIGFDAHLLVTNNGLIDQWKDLVGRAEKTPRVVAAAPFVQGPVIVEFNHQRLAPKIRGIEPKLEQKVSDLSKFIIAGKLDLARDSTVIGSELARTLGVQVGDVITIYSPGNLGQVLEQLDRLKGKSSQGKSSKGDVESLRQLVLPTQLTVTGIFESGRYLYDSEFLLVPLHIGQELYGLGGSIHGISVRTTDPNSAAEIREELRKNIPEELSCVSWMDLNKQLFDAIAMERHVMFFLLMFIILVAAFGIMNTLITVTVQKTREIGVLKALGARTWQIVSVFVVQGMVVGIIGVVSGLILGMSLIRWRNEVSQWLASVLGVEIFPRSIYQFNEIPAEVVPTDVALICVSAFVICSLAALIPAWIASRLDPVKALRCD